MSGINVVFASTPRGVLGKCFRCNDRMRTCQCFEDRIMVRRINENTDRMSELVASSFDGSRSASRLAASRSPMRPQSALSSGGSAHRAQMGRPELGRSGSRPGSAMLPGSVMSQGSTLPASVMEHDGLNEYHDFERDEPEQIFRTNAPLSSYTSAYSLKATKWGAQSRDLLFNSKVPGKTKDLGGTFRSDKFRFRPASAMCERSNSRMSESSACFSNGVPKQRADFLLRQLRLLCYRKVKGNGSDVSVREIFRHFDSNKDEDEEGAGIDVDEFSSALKKLMLGTPEDGLVSEEEAACMFKIIDTNNGGTIDYREVAQLLSQPGWDHRLVGRKSNVLL